MLDENADKRLVFLLYSSKLEITGFNEKINSLAEVLETHATRIDDRKLKAIGMRIAVENEAEQRMRKQRAIQALIAEKKAELDR